MATLIRGLLSQNLDGSSCWSGLPRRHIELCGSLLELRGRRVPAALHHPADLRGGAIKESWTAAPAPRRRRPCDDVGAGSLFATGLVAGGTLTGTVVAFLHWSDKGATRRFTQPERDAHARLGEGGYEVLGVVCSP